MTTSAKKTNPANEKVNKAMEGFASMMIEKLDSMQKANWEQPWFCTTQTMPTNLNGRRYNGMNTFLLMMVAEEENYKYPVWGTFQAFTRLSFTDNKFTAKEGETVLINKGEHGTPVFVTTFTVVNKDTREKITYDAFKALDQEEQKQYSVYSHFNVHTVFNIQQTNLKTARPDLYEELTAAPKGNDVSTMFTQSAIDNMLESQSWLCPISLLSQDKAFYSMSKDKITLPLKEQFKDGESFYGTLLHEMAHSTGAETRLNRLHISAFGDSEYAKEELVAELTSALLCSMYGMHKHIKADSIPYLQSWIKNLGETPTFIKVVLKDVQKAATMIENELSK